MQSYTLLEKLIQNNKLTRAKSTAVGIKSTATRIRSTLTRLESAAIKAESATLRLKNIEIKIKSRRDTIRFALRRDKNTVRRVKRVILG